MTRAILLVALLGASGCYNFRRDLVECFNSGECAPPDAGVTVDAGPAGAAGEFCSKDGWCAATPMPHNRIGALLAFAPDDVWAFGVHGTALRFDGTRWSQVAVDAPWALSSAVAFAPDDLYVGSNAGLLHFDRKAWSKLGQETGPWARIGALSGSSPTDLWALAADGTEVIHYGGTGVGWKQIEPDGRTNGYRGIFTLPSGKTWLVCDGGEIYEWTGTQWDRHPSPVITSLYAVWAPSETEAWAAGAKGVVLRFKDGVWAQVESFTSTDLLAISGLATAAGEPDVWILGNDVARRWEGGKLQTVQFSGNASVARVTESGTWAGGDVGLLAKWTGTEWSRVEPAYGRAPRWVHGTSETDVWIAGDQGLLRHFDGTQWTDEGPTASSTFTRVFAHPSGEVWVTGTGGVLRKRATGQQAWQEPARATAKNLSGLWVAGPDEAWAVGQEGNVVYASGGSAMLVPQVTSDELLDVWGRSPTEVWAVGKAGTVLRCTNSPAPECAKVDAQTTDWLVAVALRGDREVWIVDNSRKLHWYDGVKWALVDLNVGSTPFCLRAAGDDLYLGASGGLLYFGNEKTFAPQDSGTDRIIHSIFGDGKSFAWAVASEGTILRWRPR